MVHVDAIKGGPVKLLPSNLGDFISSRMDVVVETWLEAVKADPRLFTADSLPEPLLKDHVPLLLEALVRFLRSGARPAEISAKRNANTHGAERWLQGYSVREVLLEMYWLRTALFAQAEEFARGRPQELTLCTMACRCMDEFLNDLESRSVETYAKESNAALKKSNHTRARLIRSISHELRNMLNSVGLASSLLETKDQNSVDRMIQNLQQSSNHMKEVMDDLTSLSQILSRNDVKSAPFHLARLLATIDSGYRSAAESKGLGFEVSILGGPNEIWGDETKVQKIIENLVSNAIKYTHGGKVNVSLEIFDGKHFAIVVQDSGVGFSKEDREYIFSEFYQVKRESPLRGSGLGISIVLALVEQLNGSVELKSEKDQGSIFRVVLPQLHKNSVSSTPQRRSEPYLS